MELNEVIIRKARFEDIESISTIKVRGWQTAYRNIIDDEYLDNMNIEKTIEKNKRNFEKHKFIVAELNNEVVGFCSYNYLNNEENNADCELSGIYVKPEMKRKGIGKQLIQYVINECKNAKKRKMILWCLKENYPSRAFYEAMGGKSSKIKIAKFGEKEYEIISYLYEIQDELKLVFPTPEYKAQVEEYLQEFFDNGEYEIAGDGGLDRIKDFDKWLKKVQNDLSPETINKDKIPSTLYLTIRKSDNKIVGNIQIRHKLNEKLLLYGGHIGDSVRPSERRKGYATEQIRLALKKCKELGIDNVMMDCDKNNIGSAKSIQNNGGILENEVYINGELVQKYRISLKKRYANRHFENESKNTIYKMMSVNDKYFIGDVCYYYFIDVKDKITIPNGKIIIDNNYKWIEHYDYNSKIKLTSIYDNENEIVEWYFDIARRIGKEQGIPYEDDLYLDVVVRPTGEIILLDEDELKAAYDRLEVNKKDYDMAYNEANKLIERLKENTDKLKDFTDYYLKIMMD